jgi:hypothetical protein
MGKSFKNVFQFKVSLKDIRPPIWRRIQVPQSYTFWDLHAAIQDAMGWSDLHLHVFTVKNPKKGRAEEIGIPDDEADAAGRKILAGWKQKIARYFNAQNDRAQYIYDFGDYWEHELRLEKILPRDRQKDYPLCVAGRRACPPEDCGGPPGYEDLIEVLADPAHDAYDSMRQWAGEDFNPDRFDVDQVLFGGPRRHWDFHFGPGASTADAAAFVGKDDITKAARAVHRQDMHDIWQKAKTNDFKNLDAEQKHLAKIMLDHRDEFFDAFECTDLAAGNKSDADTATHPFLHIAIHAVVENQLESKDPVEALQFYNAMRQKKCARHDALHLMGAILVPFMFNTLKNNVPFDLDSYRKLLKKYKNRDPGRIPDLLDREPLLPL